MQEFFRVQTISELHRMLGLDKPKHPLISIIRQWPDVDFDFENIKLTSDLYLLSMKRNTSGSFNYGRNSYDFDEGTLVFIAPNQVVSFEDSEDESPDSSWTIFFHPDLIRKSTLGQTIKEFSFFDYDLNEALHTSDKEKQILANFVQRIETELEQNIDTHSQELIIINLEAIMTYCRRYYDRQFYTRANLHSDFVSRFETYLEGYFSSDDLPVLGLPTVT